MKRAALLVTILVLALPGAADAQIIRPTAISRAKAYTSLSVGMFRQELMCVKSEDACWSFGNAPQYRFSLELPLRGGASWGVAATTARMPMRWGSAAGTGGCTGCDADATVSQYLALLHLGGGGSRGGLEQAVDLSLGATTFSNIVSTAGAPLGSGKTITNVTFNIGLGIAFTVSPRTQLFLAQEFGLVIHERVEGTPDRTAQQQAFRLGGRLALGSR